MDGITDSMDMSLSKPLELVTLLDAIRSLSQQYYDENERARLIDFAAWFTKQGDTRLQTAALLFLREAQRPSSCPLRSMQLGRPGASGSFLNIDPSF